MFQVMVAVDLSQKKQEIMHLKLKIMIADCNVAQWNQVIIL